MASISLLKTLIGPWETVRASLILDLQKIQRSINDLYSKLLTGLLGVDQGGTGSDLSSTGGLGQYLKQSTTGANITVGVIPASDIGSGQPLTKVNDTNVTLALSGSPTDSLLAATTLTLGWTGTLGLVRGGTGADLSATGGTSKFLKQASSGAAITVVQPSSSDLSDNSNLAKLNSGNIFTATQEISDTSPGLILTDTDQGSNLKKWQFYTDAGNLLLTTLNDAGTGLLNAWYANRAGTVIFPQLISASGGQIQFPSSPIPSSDPHTLDDYTEPTITLSDGSGVGLSITTFSTACHKVGNKVSFTLDFQYPSTSDTTNALLSGLPNTCGSASGGCSTAFSNVGTQVSGYIRNGTSSVEFYNVSGGRYRNVDLSGKAITLIGHYFV